MYIYIYVCVCVHSCSSWGNMLETRNPEILRTQLGKQKFAQFLSLLLPLAFETRQQEEESSAIKVLDWMSGPGPGRLRVQFYQRTSSFNVRS